MIFLRPFPYCMGCQNGQEPRFLGPFPHILFKCIGHRKKRCVRGRVRKMDEELRITEKRLNRILDWAESMKDQDLTDGNFFTTEEMRECGLDRNPDRYAAYFAYLSMAPLKSKMTNAADQEDYKASVSFAKRIMYGLCESVMEAQQKK